MSAPTDPSEVLRAGLLAEAQRRAEEILCQARDHVDALLADTAARCEEGTRRRLDAARLQAAQARERTLASAAIDAARLRLAREAAALQSVHDEVASRLRSREGIDERSAIRALAALAVGALEGEEFTVSLPASDCGTVDGQLGEDIARASGRPDVRVRIHYDASRSEGGPIINTVDGRQVWDNRYVARLQRLWPTLQQQVAAALAARATGEET